MLPKISILTSSLNQSQFIEQAILSVLYQNYPNIEHIVIDGGSTDNTIEILKKYAHIKWISEPDKGQSDALNKAFKLCEGEIIGWLNSDDLYTPDTFITIEKEYRKYRNNNAIILFGNAYVCDKDGNITKYINSKYGGFDNQINVIRKLSQKLYIPQPSVFFKRSVIKDYFLVEDLHLAMDYELWLRLNSYCQFIKVEKALSIMRFHDEAKSVSYSDKQIVEMRDISKCYSSLSNTHYSRYIQSKEYVKMIDSYRLFTESIPWAKERKLKFLILIVRGLVNCPYSVLNFSSLIISALVYFVFGVKITNRIRNIMIIGIKASTQLPKNIYEIWSDLINV